MGKLKVLKEKRASAYKALEQMRQECDGREFTAEEQQRWDKMLADYDQADEAVEAEERFVDIQRKQAEERYQQVRPDNSKNEEREQAEYRSAFNDYILNGANGISTESRAIIAQRDKLAGLSAGVLIPTELASSIEVALKTYGGMFEAGELFHTSRGGDLTLPTINDTDAKAVIVAEYTQNTRRTPTFGSVTLKAHTYRTPTIPISEELMQDSAFNLDAVLTNLMSESFGRGINEHLTLGTGTGQPKGIVTCATACADKAAANAITLDNIIDLMKSVDAAYARNGKFMFNRNTLYELMRVKDLTGRFIWQEGTRDGLPATLFGKPYIINDDMADIGAGNASVLFGDLKKYKIRMVKSFRVKRLNELLAEYLAIGLLGFARVDGMLLDAGTNPVKKLVHAAN